MPPESQRSRGNHDLRMTNVSLEGWLADPSALLRSCNGADATA
jgi:hypothetical protein